jgi:transposase
VTAPTVTPEETVITSIAHAPTPRGIVVGVDTHKDAHIAVALNELGARLEDHALPAARAGYAQLIRWAGRLGPIQTFAIEGTNRYGAGLSRYLRGHGYPVVRSIGRIGRCAGAAARATRSMPKQRHEPC